MTYRYQLEQSKVDGGEKDLYPSDVVGNGSGDDYQTPPEKISWNKIGGDKNQPKKKEKIITKQKVE